MILTAIGLCEIKAERAVLSRQVFWIMNLLNALEGDGRLPNSPRSQQIERTGTVGIHGIGQDVPSGGLNQECRVADERNHGCGAAQCWWPSRCLLNTRWPGCSPLAQHPQNGREWLAGKAIGIDEPTTIKVIAPFTGHSD